MKRNEGVMTWEMINKTLEHTKICDSNCAFHGSHQDAAIYVSVRLYKELKKGYLAQKIKEQK